MRWPFSPLSFPRRRESISGAGSRRRGERWIPAFAGMTVMAVLAALLLPGAILHASDAEKPVERHYAPAPPAPMSQTADQVAAKSEMGRASCRVSVCQYV